ncbi:RNA recognition, RNP-1 [Metarhizium robertsii ARSEF 23]|uniref:RNA recognition, RNP-1 n=1 Tax=Metarhizium robertsii (strain ARSEF 23 / ATCC MYA-3075) TaxID=655844 RepID=E9FAN3_METRA|nr:RNA recognition, RNP-1 [Metarhizium robertsii ARSEF 23]EFY95219.1 RNA recognition, RNP-1 [Metarhizium robertsii ARSEF 23]
MSSLTSLNPQSAAWLPQETSVSSNESELYWLSGRERGTRTAFASVVQSPEPAQHGVYSQSHYNERAFSPPQAGAGLPSSHSCHSASALLSPSTSGRLSYVGSVSGTIKSPDYTRLGTLTEPRNFAPQTSGLSAAVTSEPPPKFDLSLATGVRKNDTVSTNAQTIVHTTYYPPGTDHDIGSTAIVPFADHRYVSPHSQIQNLRSDTLNHLTATESGLPALHNALDPQYFPFLEGARQAVATNHGVVKLKNIPFATKRSEVIAFLGRNSKILNDADEPVHIIMERVTSKTMDAYVEFVTLDDANKAVEKHQQNILGGRISRLGDRPVEVELSSQESLMKDLFPLAKGIMWNGASPQFKPLNPNEPWENFKGFVSEEEMIMLVKHVEVPHRSPFSKDCPQRPYECLISTLKKFPWYVTDRITISQRHAVFKATCELARLLSRSIQKQDDQVNLTHQLYRRLIATAMKCPGFTPLMKDDISYLANLSDMEERRYNQPRFASCWRHQYSLAPKPGMPLDVIEWYIAMIREQTHRDMVARPHVERTILLEKSQETDMYWGYFWAEIGYMFGPAFDQMTLSQAAHAEFTAVERILARALTPQ